MLRVIFILAAVFASQAALGHVIGHFHEHHSHGGEFESLKQVAVAVGFGLVVSAVVSALAWSMNRAAGSEADEQ